MQKLDRATVYKLLPKSLRSLEAKTPIVQSHFSPDLIAENETPTSLGGPGYLLPESLKATGSEASKKSYRVGLLTGCVQDLIYSNVNRDTADVLRANGCTVITPHAQGCCGSLHAHNGEYEMAKDFARSLLDQFPQLDSLDAIITNAAGCGSHLKHFDRLLKDDPKYAAKAKLWSEKVRDISEFLVEIDFRPPQKSATAAPVTYHDACHLCHGQKITAQPRELLARIPGLEVKPLARIDVVLRQRRHLQPHPA